MRLLLIGLFTLSFFQHSILAQSFTEQEIFIDSQAGPLGGLLSVPNDCERCPAVLIIQGSGPTDKDGNSAMLSGKNNSLKLLSQNLNEVGIATLRFDKRGMGLSEKATMNEKDLTFDDFVNDAELFLNLLLSDNQFGQIGIAGHSQGSLIGMLVGQGKPIKAFASIAGPSLSIDETLLTQIKATPNAPSQILEEAKSITASLKEGIEVEEVPSYLQSVYRPSLQPFMMSWMKYDPTEEINKLNARVLVVNGSTDLQVSVEDAQRLEISNEKAELVIIDGMNHVLKDAPANPFENNATFSDPSLPLNEQFKMVITEFFSKYLK